MREKMKKMWLGAGTVAKTLMSLTAVMLFSSRKISRLLCDFSKGIDTSRKAFILGCGPSLKEVLATPKLFEELQNNDVMVTNRFALSEDFYKLKPQYYILLDPAFCVEENIMKDPSIQAMYASINKVDWVMTLFLSQRANISVIQQFVTNKNVALYKYNATTVIGPLKLQNLMYRKGLGIPTSRNVIIPALELMINFGYKNIYLYGFEFSWTKNFDVDPRNNRVYESSKHFYNDPDIQYFERGMYRDYLRHIDEMLFGTEQMAYFAESEGTSVVNRTRGSFIDAFPYENPETL